jgi:acyl-CoA reductase-like NAD-dependent aldehyde dehydrogenase
MGEVLRTVFPAGVLNVVSGTDPLGAAMTAHPIPRKVSFTGSVATGKKVAAAAGADHKRVTLELGGNDPAIVLDDAELATVVPAIFWSAFALTGQVCVAIKRLYVPEALHDDVVQQLVTLAEDVKIGPGTAEGVQLGPLNNAAQLERIEQLVADAVAHGATIRTGGHRIDRPGYFYAPTILTGATDGTRIVDEEQFGPVLPVIRYRTVEDAIEHANATSFGLGASVWGADIERAEAIARRIEAGNAWVNTHMALEPSLPLGGVKSSGLGLENGRWGLEAFTDPQLVYVKRNEA